MRLLYFYTLYLLLFCSAALSMPGDSPVPGGILVLPVDNNTTPVKFLDKRGTFFREKEQLYALLPVPLETAPGRYKAYIGADVLREVEIEGKEYAVQRLKIKNRRKVEPNREDMKRIAKERKRKRRAKSFRSPGLANVDFIWPLEGIVSSPFGLRRVFNGKPGSPHKGIDIAAPKGEPVVAAADGTVVDAGSFFFSGNLVFIEHNGGLVTVYAHLDKIAVHPGERLKRGDIVGYVGSTGRVTGPHLHFGVMIDSVYVDPLLFLPIRHPSTPPAEKLSKISHSPTGAKSTP
ncbi:membrane proteins related to metalloendopeptidases [Hydrogenimonas sp.]|nr:membrane proteins related to metalloendopeptidases [Hydrogenimonas sp.]